MTAPQETGPGRWSGLAVGAALFAVLSPLHLRLAPWAFDDAYIHFRIAAHLASSGEAAFNPGEDSFASSSPAWTLLLAGLFRLFGPEPRHVALLAAALLAAAVLAFVRLLEEATGRRAGPAAALFGSLALASLLPASVGLMETPAALLVVALGLLRERRGRALGPVLLGAAPFFRLELAVPAGLALGLALLEGRRRRVGTLGLAAAGAAPFAAFCLLASGSLVPAAVRAKQVVFDVPVSETLRGLARGLLPGGCFGSEQALPLAAAGAVLLAVLSAAVFAARGGGPGRLGLLSAASGLLVGAAYVWRHVVVFDWYLPLVAVPLLLAGFAVGLRAEDARRRGLLLAASAPVAVCLLASGLVGTLSAALVDPGALPSFELRARVRSYIVAGRWLAGRLPGATLLTSEIGGLGWGFPGRIADAGGLASADALRFHPLRVPSERANGTIGGIPPGFVAARRPELVVTYDVFGKALASSDVLEPYEAIVLPALLPEDALRSRTGTVWGSRYLRVFVRKDVAAALRAPG